MNGKEDAKKEVTCVSCGGREVKYRCPSCLRRTCSLQCVKDHKKGFSCTGIRCKTTFVSKTDYNYNNMINDYRLLEDTERVSYSASASQKQRHFNKQAVNLIKKARQSGLKLKLMPVGMTKRMTNTSYYNNRNKCIMWRVKWLFPQADSEYINPRVSENEVVSDLLKKYFDPVKSDAVTRQRLKPYLQTPIDEVFIFLRMEYQPANQERYYLLNSNHTLKESFSGKTIIEFPTIHVVLPEKAHMYKIQDMQTNSGPLRAPSMESKMKLETEESKELAQTIRTRPTKTEVLSEEVSMDVQLILQNGQEPEQTTQLKTEELDEPVQSVETPPMKTAVLSEEVSMDVQLILQNGQEPEQTTQTKIEELNKPVQTVQTPPMKTEVLSDEVSMDVQPILQSGQEPELTTQTKIEELNEPVQSVQTPPMKTEVLSEEVSMDVQPILQNGQELEQITQLKTEPKDLNEPVQTIDTKSITTDLHVTSEELSMPVHTAIQSGQN